ncbi:MAG: DUF2235 domain-containing protein [Gemmataceae bacterium]
MSRKLVLCFDGTWNHPADDRIPADLQVESNARRLFESVLVGDLVPDQIKFYDEGVGVRWYERLTGGLFGLGLDRNLLDGYRWLARNFNEGDRIYLFGYSRGAYTARSLVGMIHKCGLLLSPTAKKLDKAYELYRTRTYSFDSREAQAFRVRFSQPARIRFVGVFDTVGALGIPLDSFSGFNRSNYQFHDVEISELVDEACHAVALDEHRKTFNATLWQPKRPSDVRLEQRWFVGCHSDIGGGVPERRLSDIPLRWMQLKAIEAGLVLNPQEIPRLQKNHIAKPFDSFGEFLGGAVALFTEPYFRPVGQTFYGQEVLDESVLLKLDEDETYHPPNIGVLLG